MNKADYTKQKIIEVTTNLIQESNGSIEDITTRTIAERAGVGIGLINYHFKSKDLLIEECIQRIVSNIIAAFRPELDKELSPAERLKTVAKLVIDFLLANPAVSRISILGDHYNPKILDNTMKTIKGFSFSLIDSDITEEEKKVLVFCFTSILQVSFLRKDLSKESYGIDFIKKEERDKYIDYLVDRLFWVK